MVQLSFYTLVLAGLASSIRGAPLTKRIAQVIADSTTQWEKACDAAGGGEQCNSVAVASFGTLLAAPGPCDQQNAADNMINLAKQLDNDPDMIKFAQIFAQQARNSPSSQSVPYCQQAPKNEELNGLFQCQFEGDDAQTFVGNLAVGQSGTIPFGMSSPLSPAGSCPAHPDGPIADGSQLVDITQDSGVKSNTQSGKPAKSSSTTTSSSPAFSTIPSGSLSSDNSNGDSSPLSGDIPPTATVTVTASSAKATTTGGLTPTSPTNNGTSSDNDESSSGGGFMLQNGKDAQALNAKFANFSADSSCNDGDQACVNGGFAQCVSGKFEITPCAASLACEALPLVNSPGTSITCTTQQDAQARIAATGATGGVTGA